MLVILYNKYMLQTRKILSKDYNCYVKNNNSKWTILFIHGFGSSYKFAENLFSLNNNYNIVSINLISNSQKDSLDINEFWAIANYYIKKIKTRKLIIFGHSLGGGVLANAGHHKKVKKVVWMSTIHPKMKDLFAIEALSDYVNEESSKKAALVNILKSFTDKRVESGKGSRLNKFLLKGSIWNNVLKQTLANKEFMNELDNNYHSLAPKSTFIIGTGDPLIKTKLFKKYIEYLGGEVLIIGKEHNPIKTDPKKINELLNQITTDKKPWFKKKVLKR